jgi:hypothetical protein
MNADPLTALRDFASGKLRPPEFRDWLYNDSTCESFLTNDPKLERPNYIGDGLYLYLISCNLNDPTDILNAHGAVCDYLERNGYEFQRTSEYGDFYNLVLEASPDWLAADPKYVQEQIMPSAGGRTGDELKSWLTRELLHRYRCASKPPEWIQSPVWPHGDAGPLVFLGQLEVAGYFHDYGTVYVFHDQATGECQSILQCF